MSITPTSDAALTSEVEFDSLLLKNDRAGRRMSQEDLEAISTQEPSVLKQFPFASDYESSVEFAEFEAHMRDFVMQLVHPHITKTWVLEKDISDLFTKTNDIGQKLIKLQHITSRQEFIQAQLDSFRAELSRWDNERKGSQTEMTESISLMQNNLDIVRHNIERADAQIHSVNRTVDRATGELLKLQERSDMLQSTVEARISEFRKVLNEVRSSTDLKLIALETTCHGLSDRLWNESSGLDQQAASIKSTRDAVGGLQRQVERMQQEKATVAELNQLSEEAQTQVSETMKRITGLRETVDGFMGSIKQHFTTATETMAANTTNIMEEVRKGYKKELGQAAQLRDDVSSFMVETQGSIRGFADRLDQAGVKHEEALQTLRQGLTEETQLRRHDRSDTSVEIQQLQASLRSCAVHADTGVQRLEDLTGVVGLLVENGRLLSAVNVQDDIDRGKVALMGYRDAKAGDTASRGSSGGSTATTTPRQRKLKGAVSPASDPLAENGGITLDTRCMSCSGHSQTMLSAFKMACLEYRPGPVPVTHGERTIMYSRTELLDMQANLLKEAQEALRQPHSQDPARAAALLAASREGSRTTLQHTPEASEDKRRDSEASLPVAEPTTSQEPAPATKRTPRKDSKLRQRESNSKERHAHAPSVRMPAIV